MNKIDFTNNSQKFLAVILLIGTLMFLYWLVPPLITLFVNIYKLIFIGGSLTLITMYCLMNPMVVWNTYKQISWGLTKKLVSKDKLGYMYRYHEYLLLKIKDLEKSIQGISQIKISLQRKISDLNTKIKEGSALTIEYQNRKVSQLVINSSINKVNIDNKILQSLLPNAVKAEDNEKYMTDLLDNWITKAEELKYELDGKAEEYKLLKQLSEATGHAKEFLRGDTEEFKLYQESLVQIENSVALYTANVDSFGRKVRPVLETMSANKAISTDEGLKLIEEFKMNTQNIKFKSE